MLAQILCIFKLYRTCPRCVNYFSKIGHLHQRQNDNIYKNRFKNLPNSKYTLKNLPNSKYTLKCQILNIPSKIAKDFTKVAKFCQIWSHYSGSICHFLFFIKFTLKPILSIYGCVMFYLIVIHHLSLWVFVPIVMFTYLESEYIHLYLQLPLFMSMFWVSFSFSLCSI